MVTMRPLLLRIFCDDGLVLPTATKEFQYLYSIIKKRITLASKLSSFLLLRKLFKIRHFSYKQLVYTIRFSLKTVLKTVFKLKRIVKYGALQFEIHLTVLK